jgi:hypothetical protein
MREGAWLRISDGRWWWIDEHADWIKRPQNAEAVGLPASVFAAISGIPNDYSGPNRTRIVLAAMSAGYIRMRGHGNILVFESTTALEEQLMASRKFMDAVCGEQTLCRFHDLTLNEGVQFRYEELIATPTADINKLLARKEALCRL